MLGTLSHFTGQARAEAAQLELLRTSQLTGGAQKRHNPPHAT
jgi:hypothetical protein